MAKFEKKERAPTLPPPTPLPALPKVENEAPKPVTAPELVISGHPQSADVAETVKNIITSDVVSKDKDDPEITRHPTKDYELSNHTAVVRGSRQFQPDLLARHLNCTFYLLDSEKPWGDNPLGGAPVPIIYTREFPSAKILYSNFDGMPEDTEKRINYFREQAHKHGYRYIVQIPTRILTPEELDRQLAAEDAWLKGAKKP